MSDKPPIPSGIWARILAFLKSGGTGQIVLDIHRGTVCSASINERIRETNGEVQKS